MAHASGFRNRAGGRHHGAEGPANQDSNRKGVRTLLTIYALGIPLGIVYFMVIGLSHH
ncbi:MAG TPA: hypothetical protein VGO66_08645 [Solirubrobacterales bacterium]|nr:hypothetical protein [Solirubrobacterales bacterium]